VYLDLNPGQPRRDHRSPAHCNAKRFPQQSQRQLQRLARTPSPSSVTVSARTEKSGAGKTYPAIPPHPALKEEPSQPNVRTMATSKHPVLSRKVFSQHLSRGARRDLHNFRLFIILDEVILAEIDENRIVPDRPCCPGMSTRTDRHSKILGFG
jgi:hypothetical protein